MFFIGCNVENVEDSKSSSVLQLWCLKFSKFIKFTCEIIYHVNLKLSALKPNMILSAA